MNSFSITIYSRTFVNEDNNYAWGRITIGDFTERFIIPFNYWSRQDYKDQWHQAVMYFKNHSRTCFVQEIEDSARCPWVVLWILYKKGSFVYIQNHYYSGTLYKKKERRYGPFSTITCYAWIPRHLNNTKASQWIISVEDFFKSFKVDVP